MWGRKCWKCKSHEIPSVSHSSYHSYIIMSDLSFSAILTNRETNVQLTARELFQTATLELNAFAAKVRKFSSSHAWNSVKLILD